MKLSNALLILLFAELVLVSSCKKEDLFEQPQVMITGYTLKELPGEMTYLDIDLQISNNDTREANIADVEYTVIIEGVSSGTEHEVINKVLPVDTPLNLTLPLTLTTNDAIKLLARLDAGEPLTYFAQGTFHVNDPILKLFDLPLYISGTAFVEAGYEEFYEQPTVTVDSLSASYVSESGSVSFDFDVACTVTNNDPRGVTVDEVEYVVIIEGAESEKQLYSDSYSSSISLAGNGSISLNLPVRLVLDGAEGLDLAAALEEGSVSYTVEGIFHVTKLEESTADFILPLYLNGNVDASVIASMFDQPTVEVTGYTLKELPGEYTHLDIDLLVTSNDNREAYITDIVYTVDIEGVISQEETAVINQSLVPGTPLQLTLPLTLLTNDAIQLLTKLDAGEPLGYHVTGTFHVDEPVINLFDLPIDITGTAQVEVGFEDFFEQPEITVNDINADYSVNLLGGKYNFNLNVNCSVQNMDTRGATIDEVEYVVWVEGVKSNTHYYSATYVNDLVIAGGETKDLTLPVTLSLSLSSGATLVTALIDGYADYVLEGTFHVTYVDGTTADFRLPLYDTGTVPVTLVQL
ncbi:MAG: hypothetical protein ACOYXB_14860 [Bacteroidota bacterium]